MRVLVAAAYFAAAASWLSWPLAARLDTALSASPDSLLNYWALGWNFHFFGDAFREAPWGYFDANIFAPRPDTLAYSEHLFGIASTVWPVYLATGSLVASYNAAILLSFVLSGLGMYLLVHELTNDRWAGLVAGTIYLAAPYRFLHVLQLQLLSLQWFPFALWSLLRYLRSGDRRALAGVAAFSLLQMLSCGYYAVYLVLAMAVLALALLALGRELLTARRALELGAGAAAVGLLALPFFLPYLRNAERGFYRRYEDVVHFSAEPGDYLRPSSFNKAPYVSWLPPQERSESALFPGFAAAALAAVGAWTGFRPSRRERSERVFRALFVALVPLGFVLSLGPETASGSPLPYRFFYEHVPGFSGMRVPARISVLVLLGVSALAGAGAVRLLSLRPRARAAAGTALVGVLLFEYQTHPLARAFPEAPPVPPIYRELAKMDGPGAVLELPIHEGDAIVEESLYMYYSTVHWRPLVNGYSGWWPNDYWELVGRLRAFPTSRSLRFLLERAPVRFIVVHYDRYPEVERRRLEEAMLRYRERLPVRVRIEDDVVYEVAEDAS